MSTGLFEIAQEITSSTDLDIVLEKIGLCTKKLLSCEAYSIMLVDESGRNLYFKTALGDKAGTIKKMVVPLGTGVAGWVAQNLSPVIVDDVARDTRFTAQFDKATGFKTTSLLCVPMLVRGELIGVVEALNKKDGVFSEADLGLLTQLSGLAAAAISTARLVREQRNFFSHILEVLSLGIEALGPRFTDHPRRSQKLALACGRRLNLSAKELGHLSQASLLHDIGYLAGKNPKWLEVVGIFPWTSGPLSDQQLGMLHPALGEKVLGGIELFKSCLPMIRHHHENYDGTGFPDKLAGKNIPLGARIISLVEVVEELRFHLGQRSPNELARFVRSELQGLSAAKLDPEVVQAFFESLDEEDIL